MRVVAALGGNALLQRGDVPDAEIQEQHTVAAVAALASIASEHDLVVTHGNGPQVGMLAVESASDTSLPHPFPLDVLVAQTQGMIGYFLLQALENALPGRQVVSLICQTLVRADDPAFANPTKFVGREYDEEEARRLSARLGWQVRLDGTSWRRVVGSPEPQEIVELSTVASLVASGAVVVCSGGGGIPVCRDGNGHLGGIEAVIDKDLTSALLAETISADALLLLTDVPAVEIGFGSDHAQPIGRTTVAELRAQKLPAGSMGPKVDAACRFVANTGKPATIGLLDRAPQLLAGTEGTIIELALA